MKKNQVNNIFNDDTKRRHKIIMYLVIIVCIFIISLGSLLIYLNKYQVQYVKYDEQSDVIYDVYYKKSEFFDQNRIDQDNQYISKIIDYIKADFKYSLSLKESNSFQYKYRIEANVVVADKTTKKALYKHTDTLVEEKSETTSDTIVNLSENVYIDYNKYNDLILDFIDSYDIDDANSTLYVNMYVDVVGSCEDFESETKNQSITTLQIPLTNKTMAFDITDNLINNEDNVMVCSKPEAITILYLIVSIVSCIITLIVFVYLMIYIKNTRSAKTIYEKELKKILSNYRSYIQKVNTKFNFSEYQVLKIDNFTDMLEIRDTTNQPILMVENGEKSGAYFIIPTTTKILYTYCIKVSDIEKEMNEK